MEIQIDNRQKKHPLPLRRIETIARVILDALGFPDGQLSLAIVGDDEMCHLNTTYLNRPRTTNVLSFSMQEGPFTGINPDLLGDVVICADTAGREAAAAGMPFVARFTELLLHGILHLAGYDHETPVADAAAMENKNSEILELLKTCDLYQAE